MDFHANFLFAFESITRHCSILKACLISLTKSHLHQLDSSIVHLKQIQQLLCLLFSLLDRLYEEASLKLTAELISVLVFILPLLPRSLQLLLSNLSFSISAFSLLLQVLEFLYFLLQATFSNLHFTLQVLFFCPSLRKVHAQLRL